MDTWNNYEAITKEIESFDKDHESKKQALIALAGVLSKAGWAGVELGAPNQPVNAARAAQEIVRPDYDPIDFNALAVGGTVMAVVAERRKLVQRQREAFLALPESLREKLNPSNRSRTK